jgi:hypothetical protein
LQRCQAAGNFAASPHLSTVFSVSRSKDSQGGSKLLGTLPFVSRTFEGHFKDTPFVLDLDANLYIGPADHLSRDQHAAVEVVFHFLTQTGRIDSSVRDVLRSRSLLLDAFAAFDAARVDEQEQEQEFGIRLHGTYDGERLRDAADDDLPAGPCGQSVNQVKLRFYRVCRRLDGEFQTRELDSQQHRTERRLLASAFNRGE